MLLQLENDTENLIKYKLVGGTLKLKAEVCPHKFDCQKIVIFHTRNLNSLLRKQVYLTLRNLKSNY